MTYQKLYIPENLDMALLDGMRKEYKYKVLFFVSSIYFCRVTNKRNCGEFIPLSQEFLHRFIDCHFVKRVRDDLLRLGVIEVDSSGKRGTKGNGCLGYKFTEKYANQHFKTVTNPYPKKKEPIEMKNPAHKYLLEQLKQITILPEAEDEIENIINEELDLYRDAVHARNCALISTHWIQDADWFFKVDRKTGRVFHNVCNLHKRVRPFLRYKGMPLVEVDISNCQPLLLYSLYPDKGADEARRYLELVESGKFYEVLQVLCDAPDREKFKKQFYSYLFSPNYWQTKAGEVFKNHFPELAAVIYEMKKDEYNALALALQQLEADLVITAVVPILAQKGIPIVTIHDSIATLPECVEEVKKVIQTECFRLYGIAPSIKEKAAPR